jgi:DNA-binding CsgD family transcriptional regulator
LSLTEKDLHALQLALLALHEPRDLEQLEAAAPAILMAAIPSEFCFWSESGVVGGADPLRNTVLWQSEKRFTPRLLQRIFELLPEMPFSAHAMKTGDWGPLRLSDFWTPRQIRVSNLYNDVYRHLGIGRLLSTAFFRGNRAGTLNLCRSLDARDYTERDRTVFRMLGPHFVQALVAAEERTARKHAEEKPLPSLGLTQREGQIGQWLARGRTNPEIAKILEMKPRTVEKHVENILVKLGVENRTAAARMLAGTDLLRPQPGPGPGELRMPTRKRRVAR